MIMWTNFDYVICFFLGNFRHLSSNCQHFGTHCRLHLHRPMKMEPTVSSKTSTIRTQMPGNYPKRNISHLEHGKSLKTRLLHLYGEETTRHIRLFEKLRISLWRWNRQWVPKHRQLELRRWGITQKENKLHLEHGESLKTRLLHLYGEESTRHIRLFEKLRISLWRWNWQNWQRVLKRRQLELRRRGITQKETNYI